MRTKHSLRALVKYLDYKSHARYLLSWYPDTRLHVFAQWTRVRLFASVARTGFVGGRQEGETEEDEDRREKKVEKIPASTDVVLARSTRSDARWSCLVYPNYLLSRQVRRIHQLWRFTITFYFFSSPWLTTQYTSKHRRNTSHDVFIDVGDIHGFHRKLRYGTANVHMYPRILWQITC